MSSTSSAFTGYMRERRASIACTLAALQSLRPSRPVFTPRHRSMSASIVNQSFASSTLGVAYPMAIPVTPIESDEDGHDFDMNPFEQTAHSARGGDTVDMVEVENLVYHSDNTNDNNDSDDEEMFECEVQSLLTLSSASGSLSSFDFDNDDFDNDEEDEEDGEKTVDLWADEDTADLRAHYADGWRVPAPPQPLGKRRRVQELTRHSDDSEEEGEEEQRAEVESIESRLPVKQLPKRARTGDVVYSEELTQSVPLNFGSAPTFTRPFAMQDIKIEAQPASPSHSHSHSLSSSAGYRRVFYAPGEIVPAW